MLKSFRENALSLPRLPEPEILKAGAATMARFALLAAITFVLSRATLVTLAPACDLAPFAIALFAAGLLAGINPAPLLAGCLLGALNGSLEEFNLALPIGCATILGGSLIWNAAGPTLGKLRAALRRAPEIQARSPNDARLAMVLGGLGTLVPGLVYARGEPWPSAQATAAALASLAAAPFLRETMVCLRRDRMARLNSDARTGLCLLGLMAEAGLCAICPPAGLGVGAMAVTLLWPVGGMAGPGLGAAALLVTGDARFAAALGLCGAASRLCGEYDRARSACIAAVGVAVGLSMGLPSAVVAGLCIGPVAALLIPGRAKSVLFKYIRIPSERCDPDRMATLLRWDAAARLHAMAAAFGDLAEGYLTPAAMPDEQALMARLREELCEGCPGYGDCWAGEANRGARLLCDLVALAVEREDCLDLFGEGVPVEWSSRCRRARLMPDRVGELLSDFARARRDELKRTGENRLISAQFLQAQQLIEALVAEQEQPIRLRNREARRAAAALRRADIDIVDAMMLTGRRSELVLTLREGRWSEALAEKASTWLRRAMGAGYAPAGGWGRTLRFVRQPAMAAEIGAGSASRDPDAASGDSHLTAMLDDERLLVLICDGMGSGEAAGRESAQAARLLGRFLSAGADWRLAIETVNAMLLNIAAEDMFSTVDMLILNLSTGMAECMKLAACPTLIARGGELQRIEGGRLPLGILERVQPAASRVRLMPGDVVLMASDGVMDAADPAALEQLVADYSGDMNALSEQILALAQSSGGRRDDMTAVCLRVKAAA